MHSAVATLVGSLSATKNTSEGKFESASAISRLAKVYEVARNALEYRADHLVRRAAIERILRRNLVFEKDTQKLSEELFTELRWAMYLTDVEEEKVQAGQIKAVLDDYIPEINSSRISKDWLIGMASAEIEELFNPNTDYRLFTTFVFNAFKNRVRLTESEKTDLLLYVAVDRVYSQSDEQQVAYHIYRLVRSQARELGETNSAVVFGETWRAYKEAMGHKDLNHLSAFVRRNMGPLVLLRDMYFYDTKKFVAAVGDREEFTRLAKAALAAQLTIMKSRIRTATVRSLVYVFLTKMLVALLVELPLERLLGGGVSYLAMSLNVAIPVGVMLALTATAKLPDELAQDKLINKAWLAVADFESRAASDEVFPVESRLSFGGKALFYCLYGLLCAGVFALIVWFLVRVVNYGVINLAIFLFFLSVVSFFAFRIRQTARVYSYRSGRERSSLTDTVVLPMVVVGGFLSNGVARLNFLVFIFDFVLEAPFKIILRFLDSWLAFLSQRKDEVVG